MAIEHNDFVAQTTNRQTVLNILRAREREPMHFTSFQLVAGKVQGTGQLGLNTTLNGDGGSLAQTDTTVTTTGPTGALTTTAVTDTMVDTLTRGATNWVPSAQVSVTTGTDFQIAVNATEEFYRGILGTLSPNILVHYLRQGFPPDLLSHLVLRRLEFTAQILDVDNKLVAEIPLGEYSNSPDEAVKAAQFAELLKCWQLDTKLKPSPAVRVPAPEITKLPGLSADVLSRLRSSVAKDGAISYWLEVSPGRNEHSLALDEVHDQGCTKKGEFEGRVEAWARLQTFAPSAASPSADEAPEADGLVAALVADRSAATQDMVSQGIGGTSDETVSGPAPYLARTLPQGYKARLEIDMTIRSVEGILYYLGEYARNEATSPKLYDEKCDGDGYCLPVIRVRDASEIRARDRLIDVVYRGRRYAVPLAGQEITRESGRSSQTISLVQQLLNLHRSAKDLPFTPLLRVQN